MTDAGVLEVVVLEGIDTQDSGCQGVFVGPGLHVNDVVCSVAVTHRGIFCGDSWKLVCTAVNNFVWGHVEHRCVCGKRIGDHWKVLPL